MKRLFIIILSLALIFSFSLFPSKAAVEPNELSISTHKTFNNSQLTNMSDEQVFQYKLKESNVPESFFNVISKLAYDNIVDSEYVGFTTSFYVGDNSTDELTAVNQKYYQNTVSRVKKQRDVLERQLLDHSKDTTPGTISNSLAREAITTIVTDTVDSGTLTVAILLTSSDNVYYSCAALFQWTTMPIRRDTDALGIARDMAVTAVIPGSQHGIYETTYHGYNGDFEYYEITEEVEFSSEDLLSSDDTDGTGITAAPSGYAYEVELGYDAFDGNIPKVLYDSVTGGLEYEGRTKLDNVTAVNHFATYAHKHYAILFWHGIDFSIPFAAGFSVEWSAKYNQTRAEHLWNLD